MGQTVWLTKSKTRIDADNSIIAEIALELQTLQLKCNLEVIFYNKFCEVYAYARCRVGKMGKCRLSINHDCHRTDWHLTSLSRLSQKWLVTDMVCQSPIWLAPGETSNQCSSSQDVLRWWDPDRTSVYQWWHRESVAPCTSSRRRQHGRRRSTSRFTSHHDSRVTSHDPLNDPALSRISPRVTVRDRGYSWIWPDSVTIEELAYFFLLISFKFRTHFTV